MEGYVPDDTLKDQLAAMKRGDTAGISPSAVMAAVRGGDSSSSDSSTPTSGVVRDFGGIGKPRLRWENAADAIKLDLYLEDDVKANDVCCEVEEGWVAVFIDASYASYYEDGVWGGEDVVDVESGPPLLLGRLAQLVRGVDLSWDIHDERESGRRFVSIDLSKAKRQHLDESQCIFDESLTLAGVPCLEPGLSVGKIAELSAIAPARGAEGL